MGPYRKLWLILIAVVAITFALFGYYGNEIAENVVSPRT